MLPALHLGYSPREIWVPLAAALETWDIAIIMRFFNTAGPINPLMHYFVPNRSNEEAIRELMEQRKYFVLHAPRQTGKTSGVISLVDTINSEDKYTALYVNLEPIQAARNDYEKGNIAAVELIRQAQKLNLKQEISWTPVSPLSALQNYLETWATQNSKPIVLFIDEIDSLVGDTLISVLRQLRAGYNHRPAHFPSSVCLIGVRNIRDYPIWSEANQTVIQGGSAFNISAKSLVLGTFSHEQVADLYAQHTKESGQVFSPEAVQYAYQQTQGQPWLVNALAYQACFEDVKDRTQPITKSTMERARQTLILRRDTHLDVLIDRLREPRVHNMINAMIEGEIAPERFPQDDVSYLIDLGLIRQNKSRLEMANPIYQEVIPREITNEVRLHDVKELPFYIDEKTKQIDTIKLLDAFSDFYRENIDIWISEIGFRESGPHLLLMAFLQRVLNGGAQLEREYALGRGRVDLLVRYQQQKIVIELKLWRHPKKTIEDGLKQTSEYMKLANATEGHLFIFGKAIERSNHDGITVWGLPAPSA